MEDIRVIYDKKLFCLFPGANNLNLYSSILVPNHNDISYKLSFYLILMTPYLPNSFIQKSNLSFLIDTRSKTDDDVVCIVSKINKSYFAD